MTNNGFYTYNPESKTTGLSGSPISYGADGRRLLYGDMSVNVLTTIYFRDPWGRLRQTATYYVDSLLHEQFNITNRYDWVMGTPITRGSNDHPVRDRLGNSRMILTRNPSTGFSTVTARKSIQPYSDLGVSTGRWVFGTYEQGSSADYADQRWYKNDVGRFTTADPYQASGGPNDPGSWNRYAYVGGDPANWLDPSGLNRSEWDEMSTCFFLIPYGMSPDFWLQFCGGGSGSTSELGGGSGGGPIGISHPVPVPFCGLNPVTGGFGFSYTEEPKGTPGYLRPGVGGSGWFGSRRDGSRSHLGLDISGFSGVSSIYASLSGTVVLAQAVRGYGLTIDLDIGHGYLLRFAHLDSITPEVAVGSALAKGQVLGILGQTGNAAGQPATEAHVHFEVRHNGVAMDPMAFLDSMCPW